MLKIVNVFLGGTPSILLYVSANNSIETLQEIGMLSIYKHNQKLSQQLINGLASDQVSPTELKNKGGTTVIKAHPQYLKQLNNSNIDFDVRDTGIRISPHIYNTEEDIIELLNCLKKVTK